MVKLDTDDTETLTGVFAKCKALGKFKARLVIDDIIGMRGGVTAPFLGLFENVGLLKKNDKIG